MNANELRIGNWIQRIDGSSAVVQEVMVNKISVDAKSDNRKLVSIPIEPLKPIPLDEEWLVKFGFENDGDFDNGTVEYFRLGGMQIQLLCYSQPYVPPIFCWRDNTIQHHGVNKQYATELRFVHQLQNLFFALTGEELSITQQPKSET